MVAGDYKVSIELAAKVSDYVRGFGLATKATKGLEDAQQGLSRSSGSLAAELTATGSAARSSVGELQAMSRATKTLERNTSSLAAQQEKLNKSSGGGKSKSGLGDLLPDPGTFTRAGQQSGQLFTSALSGSLSTPGIGVALIGGLVGGAVLAAPLVGAAVGGGILAGLAGVGVGAGVAASLRSPQIQGAVDELKADLGGLADGIGQDFAGEVAGSVGILRTGVKQLGPEIRAALEPAAGYLLPLTAGLTGFVESVLPGLKEGIADAAPVIDVIAAGLPALGETVGDLFETVGENADEGASAIQAVIFVVQDVVTFVGDAVDVLSEMYVATLKVAQVGLLLGEIVTPDFLGGNAIGGARADIADLLNVAEGGADGVEGAFGRVGAAYTGAGASTEAMVTRQNILNSSMTEGIKAAGGLAAALDALSGGSVDAKKAEIDYQEAIDAVTEARKKNGRSLDVDTEKGRANEKTLLAVRDAAKARAQAAYDQAAAAGTVAEAELAGAQAAKVGREQLVKSYLQFDNNRERAEAYAASVLRIPTTWSTTVTADTANALARLDTLGFKVRQLPDGSFVIDARDKEARARLEALGFKVKTLPDGTVQVDAKTAAAKARLVEAARLINSLDGKTAVTFVRTVFEQETRVRSLTGKSIRIGTPGGRGGNLEGSARGNVFTPMAAGGVQAGIYPASNPPLYQFAEPETGGELFLPRKGSKERGRSILATGAEWYGMRMVPLAQGGVMAAANGLVNVAPPATSAVRGSRLDTVEAYLSARNAVKSLSEALRENGRSFSFSSVKGRENRAAVVAGIRAAQSAAEAKFDETGSVKAANLAYAEHIRRLRATLAQQKVNTATVRGLLSVAGRPNYGTPTPKAPRNSLANIDFIKSAATAAGGFGDLQDTLSLNKPGVGLDSAEGRENLLAIVGFLEQAAAVAQDRYAQTRSVKGATTLYNTLVKQLRGALGGAGYGKSLIGSLISQYGRITLQSNAIGGVYGGMAEAAAYGPGSTLYAFREPSTGGEAFVPRYGDRARSERILATAAGWYGGSYQPGTGAGGTSTSHSSSLTVNNYGDRMTDSDLQRAQRRNDAKARVGRPR